MGLAFAKYEACGNDHLVVDAGEVDAYEAGARGIAACEAGRLTFITVPVRAVASGTVASDLLTRSVTGG